MTKSGKSDEVVILRKSGGSGRSREAQELSFTPLSGPRKPRSCLLRHFEARWEPGSCLLRHFLVRGELRSCPLRHFLTREEGLRAVFYATF